MKKRKGFNFVELMLVMAVLGIIVTLTLPILKDVKDDEDIYRAYMKKANQDVTDALSMALIKNRFVRGINNLGNINANFTDAGYFNEDSPSKAMAIRYLFNTVIGGTECNIASGDNKYKFEASCFSRNALYTFDGENLLGDPGIILSGKSVMMFDVTNADETDGIYGHVYIDMNGNKSPNELCKDRYRFTLYSNRVALDGCSLAL